MYGHPGASIEERNEKLPAILLSPFATLYEREGPGYESQRLKRFGKIVMAMYSRDNIVTTIAVSQAAAL